MEQLYTIYMATNKVNGKMYIGFDASWPRRRESHLKMRGDAPRFHSAIKKYGKDTFEWIILFQGWDRDFVLGWAEPFLISEYQSQHYGYNITGGGQGRHGPISEEHRQKTIRRMMGNQITKGRKLSEEHKAKLLKAAARPKSVEHRLKISAAQKGKSRKTVGEKNGMFGKTHSKEVRQKLSELARQKTAGKNSNARKIFTPYGQFNSIVEAAAALNMTISQVKYKLGINKKRTTFSDWGYIR